jgi:hypothetical protein
VSGNHECDARACGRAGPARSAGLPRLFARPLPSPFHGHEPVPDGSATPGPELAETGHLQAADAEQPDHIAIKQAELRRLINRSIQTSAGRSGPQQSADGQPVTGAGAVSTTGPAHSRQHHPCPTGSSTGYLRETSHHTTRQKRIFAPGAAVHNSACRTKPGQLSCTTRSSIAFGQLLQMLGSRWRPYRLCDRLNYAEPMSRSCTQSELGGRSLSG